MDIDRRPPAGPRGAVGASAERAAAAHLEALGWRVLGRNVRLGVDEIDIVALEPGPRDVLVIVEVRSVSGPRFGSPLESVDSAKVSRLYRAAWKLRRAGLEAIDVRGPIAWSWRVDLLALTRSRNSGWSVVAHVRGLEPP